MIRARWLAVVAGLSVGAACGGPVPPPPIEGGPVSLILQAPVSDLGAVLIRVVGPVDSITARGYLTTSTSVGDNARRVVVAGNVTAGAVLTVWVPDFDLLPSYSVFVEQAARRTDYTLYDTSGFSVFLQK